MHEPMTIGEWLVYAAAVCFFAVGVVAVMLWLKSWLGKGVRPISHEGSTPLQILKERYARGEIDKQEFEEKRKDLL